MTETALVSASAPTTPRVEARRGAGSFVPRLATGVALLLVWAIVVRAFAPAYLVKPRLVPAMAIRLVWELVVRGFAPAYVAMPSAVLLAIPRPIVDPVFLRALGA